MRASIPARQATVCVGPDTDARPSTFEHVEPLAWAFPAGSTPADATTAQATTNDRRSAVQTLIGISGVPTRLSLSRRSARQLVLRFHEFVFGQEPAVPQIGQGL